MPHIIEIAMGAFPQCISWNSCSLFPGIPVLPEDSHSLSVSPDHFHFHWIHGNGIVHRKGSPQSLSILPMSICRGFHMLSFIFTWGILLYEIIQVIVTFIAVILAISWEKFEFLAGLFFLFIYAVVDLVDVFMFTIEQTIFLDAARFGFILLAVLFFIIGMSPYWKKIRPAATKEKEGEKTGEESSSVFSVLKKI
jgi:hypothetical protein